ncbi:PREDICTED: WD repeat-containing protein 82 [Drosophila arizonae]|uniref:WD repeat-containing protein 82 n=1 Tax=Drosophila arizonae TaxID=7263 RepID=A0ABM1NW71_DROAR|nr:PREDICTED: WD repeat-containing protein 82 [Drosophila arizonae]
MSTKLNAETLREFRVAKIFEESCELKHSMCFSQDGRHLLVCDHHYLLVIDCSSLRQLSLVNLQKYRPKLACFTQRNDRLLHSSSKEDYRIRYLDLISHQYLRYFKGHKRALRGLCFQPGSAHHFLSAGWDDRVLMWDLRCERYTEKLKHLQRPLVAFDPAGLVCATSHNAQRIEIYDVRKMGSKPCQKFDYQPTEGAKWTQLQFAPDGQSLLVSTDSGCCFSVDAFNGRLGQTYGSYANRDQLPLQACYTPDSQHVLAGADRGRVHVWHAASGQLMAVLHSRCREAVHCLQFHPHCSMFASSDESTRIWLPDKREVQQIVVEQESDEDQELPVIDLTSDDFDFNKINIRWPRPILLPRTPSPVPVSRWRRRRFPRIPIADVEYESESLEEGEIP